jgi:replicative DNA helicase
MSDYYGKEYPQAVDAEAWLLGGILQDPKALSEILLILRHGKEFYLEKNQAVWNAMVKLYREGNPIDVLTISGILEKESKLAQVGGKDYIFSLMESVSSAANADYYANEIRDKYLLRTLISDSNTTIKESLDPAAETKEVLQSAEKRIIDLSTDAIKENIQHAGDIALNICDALATRQPDQLSGCPTNFRDLDELTNGLQKTDLIILGARPAMGKTAFALNLATNAAMFGKTVLFFSLEMDARQLVMRVLSSMAGINLVDMRRGKVSYSSNILLAKAKELGDMPLYIDDSSEAHALDLRSKCRVFKRKHNDKLDLVVVDYLQMMNISGKAENRNVGVGENSRMLKVLARELDVPVLALAQLNREVEKRPAGGGRPQLADLKESGSIEQDADMVWFIHRPVVEMQKKKGKDGHELVISEEEKREAWLMIAKHRNGPTGNIKLEFHGETTTFRDAIKTTLAVPPDDVNTLSGAYD